MDTYVAAGQTYQLSGVFANGHTLIAESGLGYAGGYAPGGVVEVRTAAINNGTLKFEANTGYGVFNTSGSTLKVSGVLINHGSIDMAGGGAGYHYGGGPVQGSQLINTGVLINTGDLTLGAAGQAQQEGQPGTAATLADRGRLDNSGTLTVQGSAYGYGVSPPAQANITGVLNNSGLLLIQGGEFFYGGMTYPSEGSGGTVTDSGRLTNSGTVIVGGSTGSNQGYYYSTTTPALLVTGVLATSGLIDVQGGTQGGLGGTAVDSGLLTNSGLITLDASSDGSGAGDMTVSYDGTLADTGTISGGGTLYNGGLIVGRGDSGLIAAGGFVNDGAVRTQAGASFTVSSAITADTGQTGQFDVAAHSVVTLGAAVASNEQVVFGGPGATLAMGDAADFKGVLADIGQQTTIDFLGLDVGGVAASGNTLRIGVGFEVLTFQLAQPLPSDLTPSTVSDSHGGTDVVFTHI